ncbi:MAG: hypothetical protein RLZZ191_1770 [Pseudomonadota bacterium]
MSEHSSAQSAVRGGMKFKHFLFILLVAFIGGGERRHGGWRTALIFSRRQRKKRLRQKTALRLRLLDSLPLAQRRRSRDNWFRYM